MQFSLPKVIAINHACLRHAFLEKFSVALVQPSSGRQAGLAVVLSSVREDLSACCMRISFPMRLASFCLFTGNAAEVEHGAPVRI